MKTLAHFSTEKKLHTDHLEEKYGPIHSRVLRHDNFMREVFLCDEEGVARTYALTIFEFDKNNAEIKEIDNEIRNNGLIGKAFRDHGYLVRKNVTDVFILEMPPLLIDEFKVFSTTAKARLSEFYAKKAYSEPIIYGTVLEVYSPDFRDPEINDYDQKQVHPMTSILVQAGFTFDEIYHLLGENASFNEADTRYQSALEFSQLLPSEKRKKFLKYIGQK
jgi:hypothetical protein